MEKLVLDPEEFSLEVVDGLTVKLSAFPYKTHRDLNCKERWRGRTISDILDVEFKCSKNYVEEACRDQRILLNGQLCSGNTVVRNGDIIRHEWTATEPSILLSSSQLPCILMSKPEENVIVAFKPHSLPTTPQGQFYKLNLVYLLKRPTREQARPSGCRGGSLYHESLS